MTAYSRLLAYARPYRAGWAGIFVVTLLSIGTGLLVPFPIKILVDHVLGVDPITAGLAPLVELAPDLATADVLIALVALAGLVIFVLNKLFEAVLALGWVRVGQRVVYDLAADMFARLQRRSLVFHARNPVGDSIARIMGDSWAISGVVEGLLFTPLYVAFSVAATGVVMFALHPSLAAVSLVVAPLMAVSAYVFGRPTRRAARRGREASSGLHSHAQRMLSGLPVVQGFAQEYREQRRFAELSNEAIRASRKRATVKSFYGLSTGVVSTLGAATVLFVGGSAVLAGTLTVGTLLVFITYLKALDAQLRKLAGVYETLQATGAQVDRVMEVLDAEPDVADDPGAIELPPVQGFIRFEGVEFGYEVGRPVLHDVDLEVRAGERVALVGPTGAGKSTLVGLVPRFFDPSSGRVTVDGHDLRDVRLQSLRSQIAIVLQEPFLFPLSIAENIAYGRPEASPAEIEQAARAANAHEFIERLPDGYQTIVGERGGTLSGGERQRIAMARALLKDAPILILDEPTSSLDAETEHLVLQALARLMAGRTTLIIAHRLSTIRNADRIVVLRHGRIVEQGTHVELVARPGVYARLHQLQVKTHDRATAEPASGRHRVSALAAGVSRRVKDAWSN